MCGLDSENLAMLEAVVRQIFTVFPGFCLGRGIMDVAFTQYYNDYYNFLGKCLNRYGILIAIASRSDVPSGELRDITCSNPIPR